MTSPDDFTAHLQEAIGLHQQGDLATASRIYREILAHQPGHGDALYLLGVAALQTQNFQDAADLIDKALALNPAHAPAWFNHALALLSLGQYAPALKSFDNTILLQPDNADAYNNRSIALRALGRHEDALASYERAIAIRPDFAEACNNRAVTLRDLKRFEASVKSCDKAIAVKPGYADAHNTRGLALADLRQQTEAYASYGRAIALRPNYAEAYNNRAISLCALRRHAAALADYDTAIRQNPAYADAYVNRGHALNDMGRHEEAAASYGKALALSPDNAYLRGAHLQAKMMICDWRDFDATTADIMHRIECGEETTSPFTAVALTDAAALQRRAAEIWTRAKHPGHRQNIRATSPHQKIRIGYFSMDFREHPIAALMTGLFESHDRTRFEIHAFSYGQNTKDPMRQRLECAFDSFVDVQALSDAEVATRSCALGIDIAVDLAGYTNNARHGIFAAGAAPIQASYLGYPGTMGSPHIDYIMADRVVIPPDSRAHYTEKVVYLPCFQVNDDKRSMPTRVFTRAELGLPATGFVFCCFNNSYKINPQTFDSWMRILARVKDSVLFLYADVEAAVVNLRREAAARGVDPARLIFGQRLPISDYLARYRAADLFLDTLPYNAGTTASDALWMGLPVLTRAGESFAGRMAAGLLHALEMQELITTMARDYEDLAITLATDSTRLSALKDKLARARLTSSLFNTTLFARHIEAAYAEMHARAQDCLPADHIVIAP